MFHRVMNVFHGEEKPHVASKSEEFQARLATKSQEFRAEIKNRFTEKQKIHVKGWWTKAAKRLTAITTRMNKIADKITTRLDALAESGKDVSAQRTQLAAARVKINVAIQSVAAGSTQIESILQTSSSSMAFKQVHEMQSGVIVKIREAHRALVELLASLRNVVTP